MTKALLRKNVSQNILEKAKNSRTFRQEFLSSAKKFKRGRGADEKSRRDRLRCRTAGGNVINSATKVKREMFGETTSIAFAACL